MKRIILITALSLLFAIGYGKQRELTINNPGYNNPKDPPARVVKCVLKGEVIDRPESQKLILTKKTEDVRVAENVIYIPIVNGKFEYVLSTNAEQLYELIFLEEYEKGAMVPVYFIAEQGDLYFTLYPMDKWEDNKIKGGKYNEAYQAIRKVASKELDSLYAIINEKQEKLEEEDKFYTPELNKVRQQLDTMSMDNPDRQSLIDQWGKVEKEGKDLTPAAKALKEELEVSRKSIKTDKELEYARVRQDITGYTLLIENIRYAVRSERSSYLSDALSSMFDLFHEVYAKKYPAHPYTELIENYISASVIKAGKPYPDVVALDLDGHEIKLSELVTGKIALIHLWASWCGPCRRHGKEMIPIYESFKDKGFTVVGIAREQNKEAMPAAVKRDNYPWVNLLELNDKNKIWQKYGIEGAGGGEFLVDSNGKFLAVNATPEEIKKILEEMLN